MCKRFVCILTALAVLLLPAGCGAKPKTPAAIPQTATKPAETTLPPETPPATTVTEAPDVATTREPTVETTQESAATEETAALPYLQQIDRADQSIYDGPGYDYVFAGTVRERGVYTIVEEAEDWEGNLWGKLKSGAGWVDLTQIRSGNYVSDLISANYADENLVLHGDYYRCTTGRDYCIPIAIRAYGKLQNFVLFAVEFTGDGYTPQTDLFTIPELNQELPLVAELDFPGDMSTYGIRFVDEIGATHTYYIYISGRNGALMLTTQ